MITLRKPTDEVVGTGPMVLPRVNLLPPEIEEVRRFRRVQGGLAGTVVLALAVVGVLYAGASSAAGEAEDELLVASSTTSTLQAESLKFRDVTATYQRAEAAEAMLVAAMSEEVRYSRFLNDLALTMPDGVWLKEMTFTQAGPVEGTPGIGSVAMSGTAFDHRDVAVWLETLAAQQGYALPQLQSSSEVLLGPKKVVDWSTTVVLAPSALSGRYAKTGG